MIVRNLRAVNFGILQDEHLSFQPGFNVLSGDIGQGKTHTLRAIAHLLIDDKRRKLEKYVRWGAEGYAVSMEFEHGGREFLSSIQYNLSDGTERELTVDGKHIYRGRDALTFLGHYFDPAFVRAAAISYQGKTDIIESTESVRRENLKKIQNLDFSNKIDRLNEEAETIKQELKGVDERIVVLKNKEYDYQRLERPPLSEERAKELEAEIQSLNNTIANIESAKERYQEQLSEKHRLEKEVGETEHQLQETENNLRSDESQLSTLQQEHESTDYEAHLRSLRETSVEDKTSELKTERESLVANLFPEVESVDIERKNELENRISEIQADIRFYENALKACEDGTCPTCGQKTGEALHSDYRKLLGESQEELKKFQSSLSQFQDQERRITEQQRARERTLQSIEELDRRIEEEAERVKQEHQRLEQEIERERQNVESRIYQATARIEDKRQAVEDRKQLISKKRDYLSKTKTQLQYLSEKLPAEEPSVDPAVEERRDEVKGKLNKHAAVLERNRVNRQHNEKLRQQEQQDTRELSDLRSRRDTQAQELDSIEQAKEILRKTFPNFVISKNVQELERNMNDFLSRAYPRYTVRLRDGKNGLSILYGPQDEDVSEASGGEQDMFNLALKVAFSRMSGLRVLMLDEVDKFHSPRIAEEEFSHIYNLVEDAYIDQVFVITHKTEIKDLLTADYRAKTYDFEEGRATPLH